MERRSGKQRRNFITFIKPGRNIGRRLDDIEFSVLLKMGVLTAFILLICVIAISFVS
jgi:hypothetical protein